MERRFGVVSQIINDDVAACIGQSDDIAGHRSLAAVSGGEIQLRVRYEIVNNFQHGGSFAFIAIGADATLSGEHGHAAQITVRLGSGAVADAVREDADFHTRARHAKSRLRHTHPLRVKTFGRGGAGIGDGKFGRPDEFHVGMGGDYFQRGDGNFRADAFVLRMAVVNVRALRPEMRQQAVRHAAANVHQNPAAGLEFVIGPKLWRVRTRSRAAKLAQRVQERRGDFLLGRSKRAGFGLQCCNLGEGIGQRAGAWFNQRVRNASPSNGNRGCQNYGGEQKLFVPQQGNKGVHIWCDCKEFTCDAYNAGKSENNTSLIGMLCLARPRVQLNSRVMIRTIIPGEAGKNLEVTTIRCKIGARDLQLISCAANTVRVFFSALGSTHSSIG